MRQFKFRAWDEKANVMIPKVAVYSSDSIGVDWLIAKRCYGDDLPSHLEVGDDWCWLLDSFDLMQWTGLQDSKGKDVYEGDIVRHDGGFGIIDYVVEWSGHLARFYLRRYASKGMNESIDLCKFVTVTGNIYEMANKQE